MNHFSPEGLIVVDRSEGQSVFCRHDPTALADRVRLRLDRHALHAWRLELPHPVTGEPFRIESPLPSDMAEFWASCGRSSG